MAQHKQDSKTGVKYDAPNEQKEFEDTKGVLRTRYEEQTTQWSKEKGQKDKQPSTKHTHKTKD